MSDEAPLGIRLLLSWMLGVLNGHQFSQDIYNILNNCFQGRPMWGLKKLVSGNFNLTSNILLRLRVFLIRKGIKGISVFFGSGGVGLK